MAHAWGDPWSEGPIARRLRQLNGTADILCSHCGAEIDRDTICYATVSFSRGPQRRAALCKACGSQLWGWLQGRG